ncbi:MAG: family 10 glycosylhydrolase [Kiritimatiellae bacterium]|nr:family 10 glycosylhydrolase [Kiritimatiellia bacterium]
MTLPSALLAAVAIVAHEPGYTTSLANHLKRWLASESVPARVVAPAQMSAALEKGRIAFLVGFASPSQSELAALRAFRARGGKLVVFHSSSPALASMMGVRPVGYRAAAYPGEWSRMDFCSKSPEGLPASIRQTSTVLNRARAVEGRSRVVATWRDRAGRPTGEPAWIASGAGFWMTHVLLADGDEDMKAQLLGAIVGSACPSLWSLASHRARQAARAQALRAYARRQAPVRGEIHATWDHSGCGLYPGNWAKTMQVLRDAHVTDLFVNVAGAGFAHYPSAVLPRSKTYEQEGDQLAACLAAAKGTGVRVHAWMICFSGTRASPDRMEAFRRRGWRLKTPGGALTEYLDPSVAAVREYVLSAVDEIQSRYPVAGVHLDFVRWGDAAAKPRNAAGVVSQFVAEARRRVKRPKWLTAAVYGRYPTCIATVGQDWVGWLDAGVLDYVVPMDYTESLATFGELLRQHAGSKARARRTIAGIGVTANESRLDARQVIDQINLARRHGLAGVSLFDLDVTLEKSIFPYLRMGIW